jgi:hypothetical protein
MKISKEARKLATELGLSELDAYMIELKANLYSKAAKLITNSKLTHLEISSLVGTSRARITRIGRNSENNVSMEMLIGIIVALEGKDAIKIAA